MTTSMMFQVTKVKEYSVETIHNFECLKRGPQVWECSLSNVLSSLSLDKKFMIDWRNFLLNLVRYHVSVCLNFLVRCYFDFLCPFLRLHVQRGPLLYLLLCFAYFTLISSSFSTCIRCTLVPKHFSWRPWCQYLSFISVWHMFCILANRISI